MAIVIANGKGRTVTVDRTRNVATVTENNSTTQIRDRTSVASLTERRTVVAVSSPGPAGAPGAPGGTSEPRTAVGAIGGHRLVRSLGAGTVGYVDSANPAHGDDTVGLTLGAAVDGGVVNVQRAGPVTFNGWSWTPLEPVFAARDGGLTQIPPDASAGDAFLQVVGHAEDATTLQLHLEPAFYLE